MAKATLTATISPAQQIVSRAAESFCSTPSENLRGWTTTDCSINEEAGCIFIRPEFKPSDYPWGKSDYQFRPSDSTAWVEAHGALGKGDFAVGFVGDSDNAASTPWLAVLNSSSSHLIEQNRPVIFSFRWYRPSDDVLPSLYFYPRVNLNKYVVVDGLTYYFTPFCVGIKDDMTLRVYEYPHDTYTSWEANPFVVPKDQYRHPLTIKPDDLSSDWHHITVQPLSNDEVLITSDILQGGGFLYRSSVERQNILLFPEGVSGIESTVGGTGTFQCVPLNVDATGTIRSEKLSKTALDDTYPTLKAFGWTPGTATNDGFLDNQTIDPTTGYAGISYNIYQVIPNALTGEDEDYLLPTSGGPDFKDFKYEVVLSATSNVSPVITDLVFEYAGATTTNTDPSVSAGSDVLSLTEQISSEFAGYKANLKLRNQDGIYNSIAERPLSQIAVNIAGVDVAVLYTLNPSYEYFVTPTKPALMLEWECGDGFEYLKRELIAKHPPYDGMLLSDVMTEFMNRLGFDASRVDIDTTTDLYLPKKRGKEKFLFKPEDGTPADEFLQKLWEWFQSDYSIRFNGVGKFCFKAKDLTPKRTYYLTSTNKPTADDYVIYGSPKVELMHDQFYNEIWVVGQDRAKKPIVSVYQDLPSQCDKNATNYVGRRLLMIVLTRMNNKNYTDLTCRQLAYLFGQLKVRITFNTRLDPLLKAQDYIQIYESPGLWKISSLNNDVSEQTMASSIINTATPAIVGQEITAVKWPIQV